MLVPLVLGVGGLLLSVGLIRPAAWTEDPSTPELPSQVAPSREPPPRGASAAPRPAARPEAAPLSPEEAERLEQK
ncbi:MAG TPA: hypothetical protein VEY88_12495, partial [Archangium sp.]|nr:hypothetical protein [Archangium sp.]